MMHVVTISQFASQFAAENEDNTMVTISTDAPIKCYRVNRDADGNIIEGVHETEENQLTMSRKQLAYNLYQADSRIAVLRGLRGKSLSFPVIASLLTGAEIEVVVTPHAKDEVDAESGFVYENDCFTYSIPKVVLSEVAEKKLNETINFDWLA